jgi:pilus assembly protein CpaF
MVDARLSDGSRLHALIPPLALDGPCVTIRRFRARPVALEAFGVSVAAAEFLRWTVAAGWNLLLAGGTSAGKTTLLNALSAAIPARERIVTIEETAELRLVQPHVVRLEARPPNAEGAGAVSVRDLVRTALRMRPDRIVVGEVRGGEALDMLQALNTGHDGSLSTVHANGPVDVLPRLETLVLTAGVGLPLRAVRSQIGAAVDAIVHVARHADGARHVEAIGELADGDDVLDVCPLFERQGGELQPTGAPVRPSRLPGAPRLDPGWFRC